MPADEFPAAFPEDPAGRAGALRWTSGILAITACALACLNAAAIADWAQDLSMGPNTARLVTVADIWQSDTQGMGLGLAGAKMHHLWKQAEAMGWGAL